MPFTWVSDSGQWWVMVWDGATSLTLAIGISDPACMPLISQQLLGTLEAWGLIRHLTQALCLCVHGATVPWVDRSCPACHHGLTVTETVSDSGLVLVHHRQRENPPNSNPPLGSVGPNVPAGFGDTHVMYPPGIEPPSHVQAWQGWPTEWDTPLWNGAVSTSLVSTLWTCVDLNTRQLASFPTYGMRGLKMIALPDWSNNPEPDTYSDWTEAAKQLFNSYQLHGEVILWCVGRYANGQVARWVVLNPAWVNVEWADGVVNYSLGGQELERADVCHIKYQSIPGNLRGLGPLAWAGRNVLGAAAMERLSANLATNGGIPWGVIKTARKLNGTESTDLQTAWVNAARNRHGAPAVLSGGIELEMLTISPRDMALLDMRVFDETRIASAFGVPPFLVGLPQPEGLTYTNGQNLFDFHWRSTLRTMAKSVAGAMSWWALPRGQRFEFDRDEYVQADPLARAQTAQILFNIVDEKGNRALTVDELRMLERRLPNNPIDLDQEPTEVVV